MKTVAKKAVHHAKKHKYKIILGAPIIFALFVNVGTTSLSTNSMSITSSSTSFITVGENIPLNVVVHTNDTANAVGSTLSFNTDSFLVTSISKEGSIVDLWAQEPVLEQGKGLIFAGGITKETGFIGDGKIFSFVVQAEKEGVLKFSLQNPEILASNGTGTNLLSEKKDLILHVRGKGLPSPDVNHDNKISLMDINIVYFNSLRKDDPLYDLNSDGKVDLNDVRLLISLM